MQPASLSDSSPHALADRYQLVVFDWDGTLCDSTAHIVHAFQTAASDLGVQVPTTPASRHIIGLSLQGAMAHAMPWLPHSRFEEFTARYSFHFRSKMHEIRLFDGITKLLKALKDQGVKLAVATGKSRRGLDDALHQVGLAQLFDDTRTADMTQSKPHPQMLHELLAALDVPPASAVMVGDTSHDVRMAQAAGCDSVAVTFGAHPADELARIAPTYTAHTVMQLYNWLLPKCQNSSTTLKA